MKKVFLAAALVLLIPFSALATPFLTGTMNMDGEGTGAYVDVDGERRGGFQHLQGAVRIDGWQSGQPHQGARRIGLYQREKAIC